MADGSVLGSCHCGSVKYRVLGNIDAFFCHCNSCRLSSGAPFVAWGRVHADSFELLSGTLNEYYSSDGVIWSFCQSCGTGIKYQDLGSDPDIDFMLATLVSPGDVKPKYHIQTKEKLPWINIDDGLPRFERWANNEA